MTADSSLYDSTACVLYDSAAIKKITFFGLIFSLAAFICAQESPLLELPGIKERALIIHIVSRIVEENQNVVWDSENKQVTIPGRPVGVKLLGEDLVVAVQFTPFLRSNGQLTLVAQGQIWKNVPNEGISYSTSMQTIPLAFREQVYFFPLGSIKDQNEAHIEIQLVVEPYIEDPSTSGRNRGNITPP
jgi:hypothetical protein